MRAPIALVLSLLPACTSAQACSCPSPLSATQPLVTCNSVGDPHYATWDYAQYYDFMGRGNYRLYQSGSPNVNTQCGCAIEVQTFMCPCHFDPNGGTGCIPGATANAAVALSAGENTFIVKSDQSVTIAGPDAPTPAVLTAADFASEHGPYGEVVIKRELANTGGADPYVWRFQLPGGGDLLVFTQQMSSSESHPPPLPVFLL